MPFHHRVTRGEWGRVEVQSVYTELFDLEANLAAALIERWGLVAAKPDGEDSAGRAKLRKSAPQELVTEACETAALALAEFRRRGWTKQALTQPEVDDILDRALPRKPRAELKEEESK